MENIIKLIPLNIAEAIGWTLLHSLWQSLLLLIVSLAIAIFAKKSEQKYRTGILLMTLQLMMSIITFYSIYEPYDATQKAVMIEIGRAALPISDSKSIGTVSNLNLIINWLAHQLPLVANIWIIGLLFYTTRFGYNFWQVNKLKKQNLFLPNKHALAIFEKLLAKVNLHKNVTIMDSARVATPVLIGYIKPIILLPIGLCSHLSAQEIEAIIAHELAHVKRNDYLVNLAQSLLEVIYFFNPAILLLSKIIRDERENCCDEFASEICGSSLPIAKALVQLETFRQENNLAMAFGRKGYSLKNRVRHLLGLAPEKANQNKNIFIVLVLIVGSILYLNIENSFAKTQEPNKKAAKKTNSNRKTGTHYNYNDNLEGRQLVVENEKGKLTIRQDNGTVFVNEKAYKLSEQDSTKMMYHQAEIKKLSEEMNAYSVKIGELSAEMGKHSDKINQWTAPINAKSQEIASLSQKMVSLNKNQEKISKELSALDVVKDRKKIELLEKQENELEKQIEMQENQMDKLENEIEKLGSKMEEEGGPMDSIGKEMEKYSEPMEELGRKIEEHSSEMYKLYPKEAIEAFEKMTGEKSGMNLPVPPPPPPRTPRAPRPPRAPRTPTAPEHLSTPLPPQAPLPPLPPKAPKSAYSPSSRIAPKASALSEQLPLPAAAPEPIATPSPKQ